MKKFLLILTVALLSLSVVACSGTTQFVQTSLWEDYEYEKLTYDIVEEGVTEKGTLVMEMEHVPADDENFVIPQIDPETGVLNTQKVGLKKNQYLLQRTLTFPVDSANGLYDTMKNITIVDSSFNPLYSYAQLTLAKEQSAYTGEGNEPACVSYVTTSAYTFNKEKSKWSVVSSYLRQKEYGNTAEWNFKTQTFSDLAETSTDMNMTYYKLRFINNLTTTDDFSYQCSNPMVLESSIKYLNCKGAIEQHAVDNSVPYIYNEYKTAFGDDFGGFALDLVKVTIYPMNQAVTGSGINIYYSRVPIIAREELSLATSANDANIHRSERVPVIMIENVRPDSATSIYPDSRGTITYKLTDITNVK